MLQDLISEEEEFQPYLLNNDYTFIGPVGDYGQSLPAFQ
jgi:hypothetical protein